MSLSLDLSGKAMKTRQISIIIINFYEDFQFFVDEERKKYLKNYNPSSFVAGGK